MILRSATTGRAVRYSQSAGDTVADFRRTIALFGFAVSACGGWVGISKAAFNTPIACRRSVIPCALVSITAGPKGARSIRRPRVDYGRAWRSNFLIARAKPGDSIFKRLPVLEIIPDRDWAKKSRPLSLQLRSRMRAINPEARLRPFSAQSQGPDLVVGRLGARRARGHFDVDKYLDRDIYREQFKRVE